MVMPQKLQIRSAVIRRPAIRIIGAILTVIVLAACGGRRSAPPATAVPTAAPTLVAPSTPADTVAPTTAGPTLAATEAPAAIPATVAPTVAAAPASNARQTVLNALTAVAQAGPYRVTSTTTTDKGNTVKMTGEIILPDRFHMVTNGRETIIVGKKTWVKQGDQWQEFPMDVGSVLSGMMGSMTPDVEKSISDVQEIGPDTVNGTAAIVYQFTSAVDVGGQPIKSTVKVWIAKASGLPIQQEIEGDYGGIKSQTVQQITYDPSIKIEAPVP